MAKTQNVKFTQTCVISLGATEHPDTGEFMPRSVVPDVGMVLEVPEALAHALVEDRNAELTDEPAIDLSVGPEDFEPVAAPTKPAEPTEPTEGEGAEPPSGESGDGAAPGIPAELPTDYKALQDLATAHGIASQGVKKVELIAALEAKRSELAA